MTAKIDKKTEKNMRQVFGRGLRERRSPASGSDGSHQPVDRYTKSGRRGKDIAIDLLFIAMIAIAVFMYEMSPMMRGIVIVSATLLYFRITARLGFGRLSRSAQTVLNILFITLILLALVAAQSLL